MRVVNLPTGGKAPLELFVLDSGQAVLLSGGAVRIFDIRDTEPRAVLELPGVRAVAGAGSAIITVDGQGLVARWEQRGDRWTRTIAVQTKDLSYDGGVAASPCGRFAFVDGKRGALVDLERERIVLPIDARIGSARPCFDKLPDGRDVLFVAAPGYMSMRMIDAVQGEALAGFSEQTSVDFCHVEFRLALNGSRLVTFGCVWAWPYEVRIYDATPWTAGTPPATTGFPLPLVRAIEPLASNTLLAVDVDVDRGIATSACLEERSELVQEADGEFPPALERLRQEEPQLGARLDQLRGDAPLALIARCIDLTDGRTENFSVHAVPQVHELNVHYISGHRIVLVGPKVLVCDVVADRLDVLGDVDVRTGARTAVTRDGTLILIANP